MAGSTEKLSDIAARYVGAAAQNPNQGRDIFRRAANTFLGLAGRPQNAKLSDRLQWYAKEFAAAAERPATVPDFSDLLQETALAYSEVDHNSDIDLVARRREIHEQRSGSLGRVSITPKSFNEDTAYGRVVKIKWAPTEEDIRNSIVESDTASQWQGDKVEAQAITVQTGVVAPAAGTAGSPGTPGARPYGKISFGSDGTIVSVIYDIGRGTRFTVACNFVTVLVGMEQPGIGEVPATMSVGVSLGMFAAPSLAPVFRTVYIDGIANGDVSDTLPVPAAGVQLYTPMCSHGAGTVSINFFDVSQSVIVGQFVLNNGVPHLPIPIPGDAVYFQITNNSGAAANYRLPFQLSL